MNYIKYGQAHGPTDGKAFGMLIPEATYWMQFNDLPELYEMGVYGQIILLEEPNTELPFVITANDSKESRAEIGRAKTLVKALALAHWVMSSIEDEEYYDDVECYPSDYKHLIGSILTRETIK